jgi:hypothetical protein
MNRLSLAVVLAAAAASTAGCPVYSNDGTHQACDCAPSQCATSFDCPNGYVCTLGGQCVTQDAGSLLGSGGSCSTPSDCEDGLTCGADNFCHTGDCGGGIGCPAGYACTLVGGLAQCLGSPPDGGDGGDGATAEASGSPGDATALEAAIIDGGTCVDGSCQ